LGTLAGPDGLLAQNAPQVGSDGTTAVVWDGGVHRAVAGQWVAGFTAISGTAGEQVHSIQQELDSLLPAFLGATVVRQLGIDGQVLLQVSTNVPECRVRAIADLGNVAYVEPNCSEGSVSLIPNDPDFSRLYGMRNTGQTVNGVTGLAGADISATLAWDLTTGSYQIVVADIDTGMDYTHPDLRNNVWLNNAEIPTSRLQNLKRYVSNPSNPDDTTKPITFADLNDSRNWGPFKITPHNDGTGHMVVDANDVLAPMNRDASGNDLGTGGWAFPGNAQDGDTAHANDYVGWNFVTNTNRPFDDNSHGTHTAGTIGAEGNNEVGVVGVNWVTQIMPLKWIAGSGSGNDADAIAAVNYSVLHGARVSSNSWHILDFNVGLYNAVKNAQDHGDLFVAAAQNSSINNDTGGDFPAIFTRATSAGPALDNVIAVAATDNRDRLASFSNYGLHTVQLGAPGVDVWSTFPNNNYAFDSGTSMATPHVAGAATLLWGYSPNSTYLDIKNALLAGVDHIASLQGRTTTGGRLNVFHSLQQLVTSIRGVVYNDLNGNGTKDPAEPGLAGWTVFLDIHNDGMLADDDPQTVTDVLGNYTFVDPPQGTYAVREVLKDAWTQTAPPDGFYTVTVTDTPQTFSGEDFGNQLINPSSIAGTVLNDLNGSGSLVTGDPGLAGWTVFIDANNSGVFVPGDRFAVTDTSGHFTIAGLEPGTYRLREVLMSGWVQTAPPGGFYDISLDAGQEVTGQDFGNFRPITLSGTVFNDLNGNGIQDPGEPSLAGWTVFDDLNNDGMLDPGDPSAVTDAMGHYTLSNIGPGTHIIREVLKPNWAVTALADGFYTVMAISGQNVTNLNFGNQSGTITGVVFNDLNGDGVHDSGEPPLSGWTVYLDLNNSGVLTPNDPRIVTGTDGKYLFTGLAPGTYTVREVLQSGWVGTEPSAGSYAVTIVDTSTVATDQDFGNFRLVTISGTVFNDINGNGTQDAGEPGLANWIVFDDLNNNGVFDPGEGFTTTDSSGHYTLANIGPGAHHIREFLFPGWTQIAPAADVYDIMPTSGTNVTGRNFADQLVNPATISGTVFEDLTASGVLDPSDPGLAGWTVFIDANNSGVLNPNGEFTVTDANGHYTLGGLVPGTYVVREVRMAGFNQSVPSTSSYTVTVAADNQVTGFDFGNWRPVSISGNVFNDVNGDGIREPEEASLPGWNVFLDLNGDGQFDGGIVEAGNFAAGTLLNTVHPKATLTTINGANGNVRALTSTLSSTGARVFGNDNFSSGLWGNGSSSSSPRLRIDFATPQASVSIDAISDGASRRGRLEIYDANNNLLGVYITATLSTSRQYEAMTLTRPTADIAYAIAGGDTGFSVYLDNLQFVETPGLLADPFTTTNATGNYSFTGLTPGTYGVGEVPKPGWVQTTLPGTYAVTLTSGQTAIGRDFGDQRLVTPAVVVDDASADFELLGTGWASHLGGYQGSYRTHAPVAGIVNGGFETGNFNGWTTLGNTSIKTSSFGTGPTEGTYDALVTNDSGPDHTAVESFLGLGANALTTLVSNVTNGSAIKQTVTVAAGTTLTFDWNFLTSEAAGETTYRDFGFVSITPVSTGGTLMKLADTTSMLITAPSATGFPRMTGFHTFSFTFTTAGTYTIGLGAMNAGDTGTNSALLVDNAKVTAPGSPKALWHLAPPAGAGTYELFATWVPLASNASNATYFIYDGTSVSGTLLGTVTVNQSVVSNDVLVDGALWKSLGAFSTTTGTFTVALDPAGANGDVVADAVLAVGLP
jgi:subtilisin family serine protease/protocatechuate 3,4-dioxygenase beta subunit